MIKKTLIMLSGLALLSVPAVSFAAEEKDEQAEKKPEYVYQPIKQGYAGFYLQGHFAQNNSDWAKASAYLGHLIVDDAADADLIKRSMILAVGAGEFDLAIQRAKYLHDVAGPDALVLMIMALGAIEQNESAQALEYLAQMPTSDTTEFVKPLIKAWVLAGDGRIDDTLFDENTLHQYHRALIAIFVGNKDQAIKLAEEMIAAEQVSYADKERAADIMAVSGEYERALEVYQAIDKDMDIPNKVLSGKIAATQNKHIKGNDLFSHVVISDVKDGVAQAMYDMAYLLYREHSSTSTRLFSNLTLALDDTRNDARLLLADSLVQAERFEEAIAHLSALDEKHPSYLETQRYVADLIARTGDIEGARKKLNGLFLKHNDVDSLIQIGDLYREESNYKSALQIYNKAASHIGKDIPEEYWYLLYARGMANEREGKWSKAERDLKAALVYRPNHPYLLNYLGYGWAEQGLELEESLELIKRALALRPNDGYITDSLGWVYYMQARYEEAVPLLEKAVELLPYDMTINDHLGDAYWQVGRKTEARFQWERAVNYAEDDDDTSQIQAKLVGGLDTDKGFASRK